MSIFLRAGAGIGLPCSAWLSRLRSTTRARSKVASKDGLQAIFKNIDIPPNEAAEDDLADESLGERELGPNRGGRGHSNSRNGGGHPKFLSGAQRKEAEIKYNKFRHMVDAQLVRVFGQLGPWDANSEEYRLLGLRSQVEVDRQMQMFRVAVMESIRLAATKGLVARSNNALFWDLRNAYVRTDVRGVSKELRYAFQSFVRRVRMPNSLTVLQKRAADMRFPYELYPATRSMQRTVHIHVGPTNSGKTYQALRALEQAKSGIYAGPLRLLAHEIYTRFLAKGLPCALITGEELRFPDADRPEGESGGAGASSGGKGAVGDSGDASTINTATRMAKAFTPFQSCTVEMTPLNRRVDVAVIDEIQILSDVDRGWAWTQAFLGVQAREVHVCGEERAVPLLQSMCARMGDTCIVHRYERLSALQPMRESLKGDFSNLRKGDAVVAFSRVALHTLKAGIEAATGRRCAIVYGSLPPETRAQQAALFNDPDNDYDFLVASDAIGMGLNLEIKRVIFESAAKHDGMSLRWLSIPEIKQIGGRAGRFRSAAQAIQQAADPDPHTPSTLSPPSPPPTNHNPTITTATATGTVTTRNPDQRKWGTPGFVSAMEDEDVVRIRKAFEAEAPPLTVAGLQAPVYAIEKMARYFPPETPLSFILLRLRELTRLSGHFQLSTTREQIDIADIIQPFPMSIEDRCTFISAPCSLRDFGLKSIVRDLARCVSGMHSGHLLDIRSMNLEILDATIHSYPHGPKLYLYHLECLHKAITLYLWLSYRYSGVFVSQDLAFHVKELVEKKITDHLENLTFTPNRANKSAKRKKAERHAQAEKQMLIKEDVVPVNDQQIADVSTS